jgi:hypothetical protein
MDALATVVDVLTPLTSEERTRLIRAAMVLLGEAQSNATEELIVDSVGLPPRAQAWMRQNSIGASQLQQVFHVADGAAELIATLPGASKKEQTYNAYIMTGIGQLLLAGNPAFDDGAARALCERSGCYDRANHSAHLAKRGNEFTGSKEKGWTLTAPGLKRGAELIKQMQTGA